MPEKKDIVLYALRSENLTGLGGPMGTEHTWTNWTRYFRSYKKAMEAAEKDYKQKDGEQRIKWEPTKAGTRTQDLGFVMYHVTRIVPED